MDDMGLLGIPDEEFVSAFADKAVDFDIIMSQLSWNPSDQAALKALSDSLEAEILLDGNNSDIPSNDTPSMASLAALQHSETTCTPQLPTVDYCTYNNHPSSTNSKMASTEVHLSRSQLTEPKHKHEKRKRKQELQVREDDEMEFIEFVSGERNESRSLTPLFDIGNTMLQRKSFSPMLSTELTAADKESVRKEAIARKLNNETDSDNIQFTEIEEWDIYRRAAVFLDNVIPDPKYCFAVDTMTQETLSDAPIRLCDSDRINEILQPLLTFNTQPSYVVNGQSYLVTKDIKSHPQFPIGTQLLKPMQKLVELVALAIDESPDGLLQVQQVYNYIMLRYPYFAFMDKLSTNSWRSSIRHALYQKWFRKIAVRDEKIGNKGCFWAINGQNTPREWILPTQHKSSKKWVGDLPVGRNRPTSSRKVNMVSANTSLETLCQCIHELNQAEQETMPRPKVDYPQLSKPTQSALWQPRSVQYVFGRPTRHIPYSYNTRTPTSLSFRFPPFNYPRRPGLPRPQIHLSRPANAMQYTRPHALPSSSDSTAACATVASTTAICSV